MICLEIDPHGTILLLEFGFVFQKGITLLQINRMGVGKSFRLSNYDFFQSRSHSNEGVVEPNNSQKNYLLGSLLMN